MTGRQPEVPEPSRLEDLWAGDFGRQYSSRNRDAGSSRSGFWHALLERYRVERVLEVGCNTGANLQWIDDSVDPRAVFGIDVNTDALRTLRLESDVNAVWSLARDLPFRDKWFDLTFTMGVLIHQPDDSVLDVMTEIVRVSRRYVLAGEYFATDPTEVPYRGVSGALFKRDYGRLYSENFPELRLIDGGFLDRDSGWDDVTWWLFEK